MSAKVLAQKVLQEFNIEISTSAMSSYRRKIGWTQHRTRYCQMIRHANKEKRVQWCQIQLDNNEQFNVSNLSF